MTFYSKKDIRRVNVMGNGEYQDAIVAEGHLLDFGVDSESINGGIWIYSTAIVELLDGSVDTFPVNRIRYIDKLDGTKAPLGEYPTAKETKSNIL